MTLSAALGFIHITDVWHALGGPALRHGRGQAFYRNGKGFNVSLDDRKGVWRDHKTRDGGGILDLVEITLRCDRKVAVDWLRDTFSLELDDRPLIPRDPRRYNSAIAEAERILLWRDQLLENLSNDRNRSLRLYHCAVRYIIQNGLDAEHGLTAADTADEQEVQYQHLDEHLRAIRSASHEALVDMYRSQNTRRAA